MKAREKIPEKVFNRENEELTSRLSLTDLGLTAPIHNYKHSRNFSPVADQNLSGQTIILNKIPVSHSFYQAALYKCCAYLDLNDTLLSTEFLLH